MNTDSRFSESFPGERPPNQPAATCSQNDSPKMEERNPVDVLAEQFAAEVRAGREPSIDDYVSRFPECEQAIRLIFPSILSVEKISAEEADQRKLERESNRFFQAKLESISDFEIIRELGRGGMGIVYEAIQKSLNRTVALKTINPQIANSPNQLQRFQREAEAAARLQHTHIIQVYGIGEEAGIHFFAMQLVKGFALSDFISHSRAARSTKVYRQDPTQAGSPSSQQESLDSPTLLNPELIKSFDDLPEAEYRNWVCRLVMDVADALSYAHSNGIFHRDIKPANLLVDENGSVLISDFGLAKFLDGDDVTHAGDLVGTLRYMAPEQFAGQVDERSDIYSLGLTLFELLTQQPAFDGSQKSHAISISEKKHSPPRLRIVDRSFSVDLETITAKATTPEPEHRYQSAAELREDLRRVLAGEPIKSRPVTWVENVWRFAKRNPAIAALSSLSIALLIAVAFVGVIGYLQTQKALDGMQSEYLRAEQQSSRAKKNLVIAKSAIQQLLNNLAQRGMFQQRSYRFGDEEFFGTTTRLSQADIDMLMILLDVYTRFSTTNANEEDLTLETAEANSTVGDIYQKLGRYDDAVDAYTVALTQYKKYNPAHPDDTESLLAQAKVMNEIAVTSGLNGDPRTAGQFYVRANQFFEENSASLNSPAAKFELARTLNIFASTGSRIGQISFREFRSRPSHPWFLSGRNSLGGFGKGGNGKGRPPANRPTEKGKSWSKFDLLRRTGEFGGKGRGANRFVPDGNERRGPERKGRGGRSSGTTTRQESSNRDNDQRDNDQRDNDQRENHQRGKEQRGKDQRANHQWSKEQRGKEQRGKEQRGMGRRGGGSRGGDRRGGNPREDVFLKANLKAEKILNELLVGDQENEKYRLALARNLADRLRLARRSHNRSEQESTLKRIKSILSALIEENPDSPLYQFELVQTLINNVDSPASYSKNQLHEAVTAAKSLSEKHPEVHEYRALYADSIIKESAIESRLPHRRENALREYQKGLQAYEEITKEHPDAHQFQLAYLIHLQSFANLKERYGQPAEARRLREQALEILNSVGFSTEESSPASRIKSELTRKLNEPVK